MTEFRTLFCGNSNSAEFGLSLVNIAVLIVAVVVADTDADADVNADLAVVSSNAMTMAARVISPPQPKKLRRPVFGC